ncbi:MAG: HNH endonuclease signature motif containing protein [Nitrososphaeria archaeon]
MNIQISSSQNIYDALFKSKETVDMEYEDVRNWVTDILENPDREKHESCEICGSDKQLELHHIRGRKHGTECITVCKECHKTLTDNQRLWDRSWLDHESENNESFLIRGLIDVCKLKYEKTQIEIYRLFAEKLTERFSYD